MNSAFEDYAAISSVLDTYVSGGRSGDAELMARVFHPAATIHGHFGGQLLGGPIQLLFDWVRTNPPATGLRSQVADVIISGTVATARLELTEWNGVRYTDMFALLKGDDGWRIVTKLFDAHAHA